jgi:thiol-disulfide isomerase/thioredoxin
MGSRKFRIALVIAALLSVGVAAAVLVRGQLQSPGASGLAFEPMVLDLGEVPQGESRSGTITIRNRGREPRSITIAAASCSCTKVAWPPDPIPAGGIAQATVTMTPPGSPGAVDERSVTFVVEGDQREVVAVRAKVGAPAAPAVAPAAPPPPAPAAPRLPAASVPPQPPAAPAAARARPPFVRPNPTVFPGARIAFPRLDTWVKGEARSEFDPGKVYVFDFFETTCGHCKEYAPLIARLAREYGPRGFEFVAITGEDPAKVRAWLDQPGKDDEVPYSVASDGDRSAVATLQGGTFRSFNPRFFVVRDGIVLWHGHPKEAEPVLAAIAAGTWDPGAVRERFIVESVAARAKNLLDAVARECDASGDWTAMFGALEAVGAAVPERASQYDTQRFVIMIGLAGMPDAGYEFGRAVAARYPDDMVALRSLARGALQSPYAKRRDVDFGLEMALAADRLAKGEDARAADTVALAWFSKGDRAQAIANGERAVRLEKDPKLRVQYERALAKYRTAEPGPEPSKVRTPGGAKAPGARPAGEGAGGDQPPDDAP